VLPIDAALTGRFPREVARATAKRPMRTPR
jgi:hypothetical protein